MHSIEIAADGIVTRGVLLDIPQVRGVPWLPPDEPVMPDDLEAAEQQVGVRVEAGDVLLVRTGNYWKILEQARYLVQPRQRPARQPAPPGSKSTTLPCSAPIRRTMSVQATTPTLPPCPHGVAGGAGSMAD